ncbi:MAG: hypothetical protein ACLTT1_01100 [[Clostridium] scindens]
MYLANYYCGATQDTKAAVEGAEGIRESRPIRSASALSRRWSFRRTCLRRREIFEDYYLSGSVYFRLKQAYLAYVVQRIRGIGKGAWNLCVRDDCQRV